MTLGQFNEKCDEIIELASKASAFVDITKESCEYNDLYDQVISLEEAGKQQELLLDKVEELTYLFRDYYENYEKNKNKKIILE